MKKVIVAIGVFGIVIYSTALAQDTLWTRTYGSSGDERAHSIQQTNDGGYIIVGYTNHLPGGDYDVYLLKTNSNGDVLWTRIYGAAGIDYGYSVQQTSDEGYIISGLTYSNHNYAQIYLIKTNPDGDILWTRKYGADVADYFG